MILETRMTTTTYEVTRKIYILALGLRDDLSVTARGISKRPQKHCSFKTRRKFTHFKLALIAALKQAFFVKLL